VLKQMNFRCWELYMLYYTIIPGIITTNMTYLLSCIKPTGSPVPHSQCTLLRTQAQDRGVVKKINMNTYSLILNFGTHIIYIYTNPLLRL